MRFFALETDYLTPAQTAWFEKELASAGEDWKIPYFHHPLYSSGERHGSHSDLATVLEPLFLKGGVSVVFAGHDHFYERIKPQKGITHFVTGSGGKLRRGDIDKSTGLTAVGYDTDLAFLVGRNRRRSSSSSTRFPGPVRSSTPASSSGGNRNRLFRFLRLARRAVGPVLLEHRHHLLRRLGVVHDDADFAAAIELELAQALAPDEEGRSVADDGADVQAQAGQRPSGDAVQSPVDFADDTDLDAGLAPLG